MKSSRKLWIFAAIVVALGVYAYVFDYQKAKQDAAAKSEQARLLKANPDQIDEILIEKPDMKIHLKRDTDGWSLIEPFKDKADSEAVDLFVSTATTESFTDVVKEGGDIDWSLYGLNKPKAVITFLSTAGDKTRFEVSEKKNFEENSYIRRNGENRVLTASGTWYSRASKTPFDFRDKRLLRMQIGKVEGLTLIAGASREELLSKDGVWQNPRHPDKKLDQNKVREVLQALADAHAQNFVLERAPTAAEQKKFHLDKPSAILQLKTADRTWSAKLAQDSDHFFYAWSSEPQQVLRFQPEVLSKVVNLQVEDLVEKPAPAKKAAPAQEKK